MINEKQKQPATTLSQNNSDTGKSLESIILHLTTPTLYSQKFRSVKGSQRNRIKSDLISTELEAGKKKKNPRNTYNQTGTQYNNTVAKWTFKGCKVSIYLLKESRLHSALPQWVECSKEDCQLSPCGIPIYKVIFILPKQLLEPLFWREIFLPAECQWLWESNRHVSYHKPQLCF